MCLPFESMFCINAVPGVVELLHSLKYVMVKLILMQVKTSLILVATMPLTEAVFEHSKCELLQQKHYKNAN